MHIQISIIFENNTAAVGAAIYSDNAALCSWIQLQEPFFNKTEYFRSSAMIYRQVLHYWNICSSLLVLHLETTEILAMHPMIMTLCGMYRVLQLI